MRSSLLLLLPLAACATTRLGGDLSVISAEVAGRGALPGFAISTVALAEEVPEEVDRLLAQPLTADAAVRVALLANPEGRAALAQVGIARGRYVQAGLLPNPEVEIGVRGPGGDQPLQLDLGLEYSLTAIVLAPLRASVAEAELEAERLGAAGALLDLVFETRLAFLEVQALQQKLDLRQRFLESQQASYASALELSEAGNLPPASLANERASVELARVQVAEAENALLDAREALTRRLGLSGRRVEWSVAEPLPLPAEAPGATEAETRAVAASLELLALRQRIEAASRKVRLANTEGWLPHVSGGFHGERDGQLWELGAHLTLSLPVFDRAQGRELSARSEYEGLRARAEAIAVGLRSSVRASLNRVESASRRARHYVERLVPARQQQLEQTVLQYNAMQVGVFQVLQVQRGVTDAAIAQVDATLDYWRSRAALDLLLAGRSTPLKVSAVPSTSSSTAAAADAAH